MADLRKVWILVAGHGGSAWQEVETDEDDIRLLQHSHVQDVSETAPTQEAPIEAEEPTEEPEEKPTKERAKIRTGKPEFK